MAGFAKRLIVVGDRIVVRPEKGEERSHGGLYVPASAVSSRSVRGGTVMAVGPGFPVPEPAEAGEPWQVQPDAQDQTRYVPLQAREGDYAIFLRNSAVEIDWQGERLLIVSNAAVLVLLREEIDLGDLGDGGAADA